MLTKRAFLLHYAALQEFAELRSMLSQAFPATGTGILEQLKPHQADYIWHFLRPYVCVIHEDGRGYYLDRDYRHIISVENIPHPHGQEDGIPSMLQRVLYYETALNHQAASFTTPDWAKQLPVSEFNTYWLY